MKVRFSQSYDHKWPSRAVTHFPAGWSGTVRREVGERAIELGKATLMETSRAMAGSDSDDDGGEGVPVQRDASSGE